MLPSATPSLVEPFSEAGNFTPRRIRHITGIQIRNLTPFPVRDSFTSALAQPAEQSYFNVSGTTDDLGTIVSRRRTRKSSTVSSKTLHILNREDENFDVEISGKPRARRSSSSTITYPASGQVSTSPSDTILSISSSSRSSTFRRIRPRTSSMSSFGITQPSNTLLHNTSASVTTSSFLVSDNSQSVLRKVIDSRLIETFIAVFIPTRGLDAELENGQKLSRSAPASKSAFIPITRRPKQTSPTNHHQRTIAPSSTRNAKTHTSPDSAPPSRTTFKTVRIGDNVSKVRQAPHARTANRTSTILQPSSDSEPSPRLNKPIEGEATTRNEDSPAYFSPIHRPSTNPFFPIDARSNFNLPHWIDTSGQRMRVEVWGKIDSPESQDAGDAYLRQGWKVLDEWDFDLDSLVPLPVDLDTNSSLLPSNTLVLSLSPPGQSFYLPSSSLSRSSTPSTGYTSDPESATRKANQINKKSDSNIPNEQGEVLPLPRRRHRSNLVDNASHSQARGVTKTAGWQDLFKLVTLQSCIIDNENSARDVVEKIDDFWAEDRVFSFKRQISEREVRIEDLQRDHNVVLEELRKKRQQITERKQRLKQRRTLLESAYDEVVHDLQLDKSIQEERDNSTSLYKKINSARTTLLSTLSNIYPIELYSPPDLLYTILDVPLPIPVSPNDPAPPLSLPDHKEVNEEAVATALGYVAQVLQILAAYVGKKLIYPVTCIGSRSLIRDGISAMVGPRMFPLFSKGVDTYRFEYGVFLLNKDIEMLMSERDLRALDIRHTLPNLKNLILTLSHDANATEERIQMRSSIAKIPDLETHMEEPPLEAEDLSTPKASRTLQFHKTESTPPQSGSATPTTITDESRKQKSFLGFVPFSDYLWTRNLSTSQSVGDEGSTRDAVSSNDAASLIDHDEDDRKTIQGVTSGEVHSFVPELDSS